MNDASPQSESLCDFTMMVYRNICSTLCLLSACSLQGADPEMAAHFINVGQANATLLEFPCGAVLIDAGSQDGVYQSGLIGYLNGFFARRPTLNRTLDAVFITHNHIDHTLALRSIVENFTVKRYFDNGQVTGKGTENANWLRQEVSAGNLTCKVRAIFDPDVKAVPGKKGLTDADIDPVKCSDCDPLIVLLSGQRTTNPGWPVDEFENNKNNHSILVRIDFGEASFLFTGDLEKHGIQSLLTDYDGTTMLDTDVYHVGHHGSYNGTTQGLLDKVTPTNAVISVGPWNFGKDTQNPFTTWAYGHPRLSLVELLSANIIGKRSQTIYPQVATKAKVFASYAVKKRIYATAWDGNIVMSAKTNGQLRTTRNN